MRILLIVLLFPLLLLLLLWGLSPYYLPDAARHAGVRENVQVHELSLGRPGLRGWVIHQGRVTLPDGTEIVANDLLLHWQLADLRYGRLARLDIGEVVIRPATPQTERQPVAAVVPAAIPAYVLEQLPIDAWSISRLRLQLTDDSAVKMPIIQSVVNGNKSKISIWSMLRTPEAAYVSQVDARPGHRHQWTLHTFPAAQPVLELLESRPEPEGLRTVGRAQVETGHLAALLRALGLATPPALASVAGQVRLHWQGTLPPQIQLDRPWSGLQLEGQCEAELLYTSQEAGQGQLDAALTFALDQGQMTWQAAPELRLRLAHPELDRVARDNLGAGTGDIWTEWTSPVALQGFWKLEEQSGNASGTLHLELHGGRKLLAHQRLQLLDASLRQGQMQASLKSTGSVQPLAAAALPLREFGWQFQGVVEADLKQARLLEGWHGTVRAQAPRTEDGPNLPPLTLRIQLLKPLVVDWARAAVETKGLVVTAGANLPTLLQPWLAESDVTLQGAAPELALRSLQFDPEQGLRGKGELRLRDLVGQTTCCRSGRLQARVQADLNASGATGRLEVRGPDNAMVLQSDWQSSLASGRLAGTLEVLPGLAFPEGQKRLASLLEPWPGEIQMLAGSHQLGGSYWFERAEGFNADLHWLGQGLRLQREEVTATGLRFESRPEVRASGIGLGQYAHFELKTLDAGFPIRNIRGDLWVRIPLRKTDAPMLIRHFSAELLGGRVHADQIPLPVGQDEVQFTLQVEGIDLAALLQLEQRDDLSGTGLLDGAIPFRWNQAGISVDRGRLAARAPGGFLKFQPDARARALARTQPSLGVALRALENFQYRLLEAGLDYREDGQLVIALKIQGENPELHDGHPVHLNITVEENVLTLLKSLQYSDELSDRIGNQYRKGDL